MNCWTESYNQKLATLYYVTLHYISFWVWVQPSSVWDKHACTHLVNWICLSVEAFMWRGDYRNDFTDIHSVLAQNWGHIFDIFKYPSACPCKLNACGKLINQWPKEQLHHKVYDDELQWHTDCSSLTICIWHLILFVYSPVSE